MKNRFFSLLPALLTISSLLSLPAGAAYGQTWQWAKAGGVGSGLASATDAAGNVYVTGSYGGTVAFGTTTLTSVDVQDAFVAKLNASGVYQWAKNIGGLNIDTGYGVAVDATGNVYVTGSFESPSITLGATTITNVGTPNPNAFVAKLNSAGAWQWAKSAGGLGGAANDDQEVATSLTLDATGNVYICGFFGSAQSVFGTTTLTNAGAVQSFDTFVAKLNPAGAWQWAKRAGGTGNDMPFGLAVSSAGTVAVTGNFNSRPATFGTTTLAAIAATGGNEGNDLFVATLDGTGNWGWAKRGGGNTDDLSVGIGFDTPGNLYVSGEFGGAGATIGSTTLPGSGSDDLYVAKLDATGNWLWAKKCGGINAENPGRMAVDAAGNCYVTGDFETPAQFGPITLTGQGGADAFVAKINAAGAWQWATAVTGAQDETIIGVSTDATGGLYVAGDFQSPTLHLGPVALNYPLAAGMPSVFFVARLNTPTGLPADAPDTPLAFSPNPAHERVTVTDAPPGQPVELLDLTGRVVRATRPASAPGEAVTLDVTGLPAGLYSVRSGAQTQRLMVE